MTASQHFPHVKSYVRAHDVNHGLVLEKAGATAVVPETLEPSLQARRSTHGYALPACACGSLSPCCSGIDMGRDEIRSLSDEG
jgi:hypothetical protein